MGQKTEMERVPRNKEVIKSEKKMRIRPMETEDVPAVADMEQEIFSIPWSAQAFTDALEADYTLFLVAEVSGVTAGYIGVYLAADEAEITNVAVHERYRRCHLGELLVGEALNGAEKRGAVSAFLEVRISNAPAIRLYEKMGFGICGIRKGFYEKPREDAYVMTVPDISTVQVWQ